MHSILSAVSLNAILRSPLKVPYSYHPLGVTAFVAFTSAAVATSQRLRGAVSGAVRKSTVLLHGTFSFLALLSLAAAQVAIVRFFLFFPENTLLTYPRSFLSTVSQQGEPIATSPDVIARQARRPRWTFLCAYDDGRVCAGAGA